MGRMLKVGALAERTGLTVRTLHHYHDIGLLEPSGRTPSGHRLYGEEDVARLQQIASLKHLGLSLDEIKTCLSRTEYTLERTLELQLERIEREIARQQRLRDLVEGLRERVRSGRGVSIDQLTSTIEVTVGVEKYYSSDQLERLRERREEVGDARMRAAAREWEELIAAYGRAMAEGLDPTCEEVRMLARRSASLVEEFTGGDPGILSSLTGMYRGEGADRVLSGHGMSVPPGLWEYMARARAALDEDR